MAISIRRGPIHACPHAPECGLLLLEREAERHINPKRHCRGKKFSAMVRTASLSCPPIRHGNRQKKPWPLNLLSSQIFSQKGRFPPHQMWCFRFISCHFDWHRSRQVPRAARRAGSTGLPQGDPAAAQKHVSAAVSPVVQGIHTAARNPGKGWTLRGAGRKLPLMSSK